MQDLASWPPSPGPSLTSWSWASLTREGDQQQLCNLPEGPSWGSKARMSLEVSVTEGVSVQISTVLCVKPLFSFGAKMYSSERLEDYFLSRQRPCSISWSSSPQSELAATKPRSACVPFLSLLLISLLMQLVIQNKQMPRTWGFHTEPGTSWKASALRKSHALVTVLLLLAQPHLTRLSHNTEEAEVEWLPQEKEQNNWPKPKVSDAEQLPNKDLCLKYCTLGPSQYMVRLLVTLEPWVLCCFQTHFLSMFFRKHSASKGPRSRPAARRASSMALAPLSLSSWILLWWVQKKILPKKTTAIRDL